MKGLSVLGLILCGAAPACGVYMPVQDTREAYPLVRRVDTAAVVRWSVGEVARLRLSGVGMRVSNRGIRFLPREAALRGLGDWGAAACPAEPGALCETPGGTALFPEASSAAVIPDTAAAVTDPFAAPIAGRGCSRFAARVVESTDAYAVSLCDVTQKGYDFLLADGEVHARRLPDRLWYYLLVSAGVIVLVTSLAQNVAALLGEKNVVTNRGVEFASVVVLLALCWYELALVTVGDVLYFFFCVGYVAYNALYWAGRHAARVGAEGVPVNILLGTLLLTMCRLYNGAESEYIAPVLFLLLTRTLHKARILFQMPVALALGRADPLDTEDALVGSEAEAASGRGRVLLVASQVSLLLDFVLAGLTHQYGFRPLFVQGAHADLYFAVMLVLAHSLVALRDPLA